MFMVFVLVVTSMIQQTKQTLDKLQPVAGFHSQDLTSINLLIAQLMKNAMMNDETKGIQK